MFSQDRQRARLVSNYADSLIARRRVPSHARARPLTSKREDFAELLDLVRALDDLNIVAPEPPSTFPWRDDDNKIDIPSVRHRPAGTRLLALRGWLSVGWYQGVTVMASLVIVLMSFSTRGTAPALSADHLLNESEAALEALLGPGKGVYRLWDASHRAEDADGRVTSWKGTIHEWMEGAPRLRMARRAVDERGQLLWVLLADRESNGRLRSRMYYTPHNPVGPRSMVTVDSTTDEYRRALSAFPPGDRSALELFFNRSYGPGLAGERVYNGEILGTARGGVAEPVVSLSSDSVDGVDMHRLEIFEPRRLWFSRRDDGALTASFVRYSQRRSIAQDTRFTTKVVTEIVDDSGGRVTVSWTVRSKELRRLGDNDRQAFIFEAPTDVPVRQAQAEADLARMLPAFRALWIERTNRTEEHPTAGSVIKRP
jgi:hypothetical protein